MNGHLCIATILQLPGAGLDEIIIRINHNKSSSGGFCYTFMKVAVVKWGTLKIHRKCFEKYICKYVIFHFWPPCERQMNAPQEQFNVVIPHVKPERPMEPKVFSDACFLLLQGKKLILAFLPLSGVASASEKP